MKVIVANKIYEVVNKENVSVERKTKGVMYQLYLVRPGQKQVYTVAQYDDLSIPGNVIKA